MPILPTLKRWLSPCLDLKILEFLGDTSVLLYAASQGIVSGGEIHVSHVAYGVEANR